MPVIPRIGDTVHYVQDFPPGSHHPAIVILDGMSDTGPLKLSVLGDPVEGRDFTRTVDGSSVGASVVYRRNVAYAPAAEQRFGTWHWPEHRPLPREPLQPAEPEPLPEPV